MRIALTGSVATDNLMHFPGRFADQFVPDQMRSTLIIETVGTQEYVVERKSFLTRLAEAYGEDAATEVGAHLR